MDSVHAKLLQSCPTLWDPIKCSLPGSSVQGVSRWEYWLPCPPPGDLPDPGIEPTSPKSSALAGKLFATSATWEALKMDSVQFSRSVVSNSLRPHEAQHARPPCPSPTPRVHSDSRPSSRWCHPVISSSVVPSPPAPNPSQHQNLFQWVNSLHEVAKVLEFQL